MREKEKKNYFFIIPFKYIKIIELNLIRVKQEWQK